MSRESVPQDLIGQKRWWSVSLGARLRNMTVRQTMSLAVVCALGAGAVVLALVGWQPAATAVLALLGVLVFVGVLQLRRRVGGEVAALRADVAKLTERVMIAQRQVVAAVEDERTTSAERHDELLQAVTVATAACAAHTSDPG